MTTDELTPKQKRSKLKITLNDVVDIFIDAIETDGVDKAREFFEQMNNHFSVLEGWHEAAKAIRSLLAQAQKQQHKEKLAEELAKKRAGAPNVLLMSQNEANGMKDSRIISNRDITMTGENATYNEYTEKNE